MEENVYQITGYQLVSSTGSRDTVKLVEPKIVPFGGLDEFRRSVKNEHGCQAVNLYYSEIPITKELVSHGQD